ncbi:RNA polymerase sigma factor [Pseudoflavonifractor hominis]|uniref:RNA polymerase sigma-70 region 2 domain-containing protein n=1 Tax=Pseudoflavonifractor hominis TaxID=2763059 RepID=A0ABR7HSZ2_9FIRM|nr:sigma factor [Pseudoflavonifractor hominis]MBC5730541.1 hypothetical protein [Pseudoflavonifractor hominis]
MEDTAVEQALEAHGAAILHLAYAYLHDRSEAEDVLQDTLVQLLSRAPAFETGARRRPVWPLRWPWAAGGSPRGFPPLHPRPLPPPG